MSDPDALVEPVFPAIAYQESSDTWHLTFDGTEGFAQQEVIGDVPEGDFTAICTVTMLPAADLHAGAGLVFMGPSEPSLYLLVSTGDVTTNLGFETSVSNPLVSPHLKIEYRDGSAYCYMSPDGIEWTEVASGEIERPHRVGVVLRYSDAHIPVSAAITDYKLVAGMLGPPVEIGVRSVEPPPPGITVFSSSEPLLHGLIAAQFGDLEFDVGKSVRWQMYFVDHSYILDVNLGTQRYWVVNWALTFPEAQHGVTGINYFYLPDGAVNFRKEQFHKGDKAWRYDDNDWIYFGDAHEGLSVDDRFLPDDYNVEPFRSFLYREVTRAITAESDRVVIPYFVFLRSGIIPLEYEVIPADPEAETPTPAINADQPLGVPYYLPHQGLTRLIRVAALRDPEFDWTVIDTPSAPDTDVKIQIISYGYAHWNLQDVVPPATEPAAINADNDDGWRMRNLLSQVRPIPTLPLGTTWQDPSTDPTGLVGPWPGDGNIAPGVPLPPSEDHTPPPAVDVACEGIRVPLYETEMRINLRDGVWWEVSELGNIPLGWDDVNQKWIPRYPVDEWVPENFTTPEDAYFLWPQ